MDVGVAVLRMDASAKYAVSDCEGERNETANNCPNSGATHVEEKTKATCEVLNGPLENTGAVEEVKTEQGVSEVVVNGPV
ncbi:hypothetical protein C0J50_5870 [Silurus asotus]|uniref:Uncharacterized protein n=1 Tax=Silurus asotus TaxID=30991 RepID=A0AAD5FBN9_SILAS|nr:hypothetical protein C0J50_5870 [Silurus asotus]